MRTNDIKALAEEMEEDYDEALSAYVGEGGEPGGFPDIFTWVVEQQMTAQEYHNDYLRDEGIPDE